MAVQALPLGFHYAGCPSVIATLWPVADGSTAELMVEFYRGVQAAGGRSKAERFWAARRALRATYAEPFFWAPFIYIGAPD